MKKALFLIFILLSSCLPFAFTAIDEGYGEDQTALGQFVDSFENLNNVSVIVDLIRNSTLHLIELNATNNVHGYIDFDTYTENDAGNRLTQANTFSYFTALERTRDNTYLRYDHGAGNIDDFADEFELYIDSATPDAVDRVIAMVSSYTDGLNDWINLRGASVDQLAVTVYVTNNEAGFRIQVRESNAGSDENTNGAVEFDEDTVYYLRFVKDDNWAWCEVYDDSARTNLLENITRNLDADHTYRYHLAPQSADFGATGDWITGYVNNYWNGTMAGGYVSDGYFTTDDYMNDTLCNGTTLGLMVNSSIPGNTDIQVQFSNDNVTWGDWEGTPLDSNILLGGFETIDLRYLNETDNYLRFNLSTTDNSLTPRLYQVRLISTIGNATAGGAVPGPSGGGAIGLIMLILICSPLIVLVVWRSKRR